MLTLDDPRLFSYPWIYFVEPGNLKLTDSDVRDAARVPAARRHARLFDDFHGPFEWEHFAREMKRVFPDREIVEIPKDHPVFSCFYKLDGYPQVAGLGSFLAGRTWEKGGFVAHLRTILDDNGRPMMFINWNTDMGDGWEWSNAEEYPGYIKYTVDGVPDGHQRDRLRAHALNSRSGQLTVDIVGSATLRAERRTRRGRPRADSHRAPQGHRRAGRGRRAGADRAVHRRPLPDHRRARAWRRRC